MSVPLAAAEILAVALAVTIENPQTAEGHTMTDKDSRFVAEGGNDVVVGFETAPLTQDDWLTLGAGVWGRQCGLVAVGGLDTINALMAAPNPDPNISPNDKITRVPAVQGTGITGLGDLVGARGTGSIGVEGLGKITGVNGEGITGVFGKGASEGVQGEGLKVGVRGQGGESGILGEGPIGVFGDARNALPASQDKGAGVKGQSDRGIGVLGVSRTNRAGVFGSEGSIHDISSHLITSMVVPQICLPAIALDTNDAGSKIPRAGIAGDLLAVMPLGEGPADSPPQAQLWFCVSSGTNDPSGPGASWAPAQLGTTVTVP
jgi:hypothetical protein